MTKSLIAVIDQTADVSDFFATGTLILHYS